ncbi:AAA family ATPase [Agarilytica rhodophyticola]|uniref:AAA family ATPase n=1 Tax=Agarilytica rhodophyticola TaxID=1737490 RepID=UPI000B348BEA|nr:AAA family ATPase [Agarilytica rhodophyticola]
MNNNDLRLILNTKVSLVVIETYDEPRALSLLESLFKYEKIPAWRWSATEGMAHLGFGLQLQLSERRHEPEEMLKHIKSCAEKSAFVLCDIHPYLDEPKNIRHLKDIVFNAAGHKVVLVSHELQLPPELSRYAASVSLSMPTEDEILAIIREEARSWAAQNNKSKIKTDSATLQKLVDNLKGLPHQDVRRLAHGAIADDGAITESELPSITRRKFELMDMEGVLHFEYSTAHLKDVGGLNTLKTWLEERRNVVTRDVMTHSPKGGKDAKTSEVELDAPKGVLLFGVQGGGKSLAAKSIAGVWGLPLLRLDMASLFNKYVGETEKNMREALKLADMMSPCVLWMDELEKGMAQDGSSDSATGKRLLGTMLTWMSERKSSVFLVATSNDISTLPPELMRKGRFDEIFFVDLPDAMTRGTIFSIHIEKRGLALQHFNPAELAEMADGFTGAEIEQAVVSATYSASAQSEAVAQHHIVSAIQNTQPLSVVMAEQISQLRAWAHERAVIAN